MKPEGRKISMVTAYDFWTAQILNESDIDCLLVGDSLAMVMHGYPSTIYATVEMMALHTSAVARGAPDKLIITDMPFLTFRKGIKPAMDCAESLMQAGACGLKLEGVNGHEETIRHMVGSGIPVMGHIGLTPQSTHQLGGFRVQGRKAGQADELISQARKLQELGCFSVVLECIPSHPAKRITETLTIPTIGIGAGIFTDGQVLVLQDLLGANDRFHPKFLRKYLNSHKLIKDALNRYDREVKNKKFPTEKESY